MEGGGDTAASLYEILFDLEMDICNRFHLSPFEIRRERLSEFCLLVKRMRNQLEREKEGLMKQTKGKKQKKFIPVTDYKEPK